MNNIDKLALVVGRVVIDLTVVYIASKGLTKLKEAINEKTKKEPINEERV